MAHVLFVRASKAPYDDFEVLMQLRGARSKAPHTWGVAGGKWTAEERETIKKCKDKKMKNLYRRLAAIREAGEECGGGSGITPIKLPTTATELVMPSTIRRMITSDFYYPSNAQIQARSDKGKLVNTYYFVCPISEDQAFKWKPKPIKAHEYEVEEFCWIPLKFVCFPPAKPHPRPQTPQYPTQPVPPNIYSNYNPPYNSHPNYNSYPSYGEQARYSSPPRQVPNIYIAPPHRAQPYHTHSVQLLPHQGQNWGFRQGLNSGVNRKLGKSVGSPSSSQADDLKHDPRIPPNFKICPWVGSFFTTMGKQVMRAVPKVYQELLSEDFDRKHPPGKMRIPQSPAGKKRAGEDGNEENPSNKQKGKKKKKAKAAKMRSFMLESLLFSNDQGLPWPPLIPASRPTAVAEKILRCIESHGSNPPEGDKRWLVALAGIPASGKSTLSKLVVEEINRMASNEQRACLVPMDGFHYTRRTLDEMPSPQLMHSRRGAEYTFDTKSLTKVLEQIRTTSERVEVPGFDHKLKDPTPGEYVVEKSHNIVLVEGLYLLLEKKANWKAVTRQFHVRCFLYTPFSVAERRIIPRHVEAGIAPNKEMALQRWLNNDKRNALVILENLEPQKLDVRILTVE